jgi:hypothetical protein
LNSKLQKALDNTSIPKPQNSAAQNVEKDAKITLGQILMRLKAEKKA